MDIKKIYRTWVENVNDKELLDELKKIETDEKTKTEIFYKNIEFGTAGLRGIIGAGTNRMNVYTVRLATQALSSYLNEKYKNPSVVISYDSRKNSKKFSYEASAVLAANNIKVYITEKLQPTPFLSFCVRNLKCSAGIMITASHNTAEYNGYKCYGEDGAQISEDISKKIYDIMCKIDVFKDINTCDFDDMFEKCIISFVPKSTYENYLTKVYEQRLQNFPISNLKVVYTPLNGSGNEFVRKVLSSSGVVLVFPSVVAGLFVSVLLFVPLSAALLPHATRPKSITSAKTIESIFFIVLLPKFIFLSILLSFFRWSFAFYVPWRL